VPPPCSSLEGRSSRPAFAADTMLGSLARKLRMLGYDTTYFPEITLGELKYHCRAESRILLTRNRRIRSSKGLVAWQVSGNGYMQEFWSISCSLAELGFAPVLLGRCTICNGKLERKLPDQVRDRVPPHVLSTRQRFLLCPGCRKVYWKGTHEVRMREEAREMMEIMAGNRD